MIYRKWSLLTGPAALFGGIAATFVVVDIIFRKQDQFTKPPTKEPIHAAN